MKQVQSYHTALKLDVRCMRTVKTNITLPLRCDPTGGTAFFSTRILSTYHAILRRAFILSINFSQDRKRACFTFPSISTSTFHWLVPCKHSSLCLCITFSCRCCLAIYDARQAFHKESSDTWWTGFQKATEKPKMSQFASWRFSHSKWGQEKKNRSKMPSALCKKLHFF